MERSDKSTEQSNGAANGNSDSSEEEKDDGNHDRSVRRRETSNQSNYTHWARPGRKEWYQCRLVSAGPEGRVFVQFSNGHTAMVDSCDLLTDSEFTGERRRRRTPQQAQKEEDQRISKEVMKNNSRAEQDGSSDDEVQLVLVLAPKSRKGSGQIRKVPEPEANASKDRSDEKDNNEQKEPRRELEHERRVIMSVRKDGQAHEPEREREDVPDDQQQENGMNDAIGGQMINVAIHQAQNERSNDEERLVAVPRRLIILRGADAVFTVTDDEEEANDRHNETD